MGKKITGFKDFVESTTKALYFTFGRFNPPTRGHGVMLDELKRTAGSSDYKIYPSPNGKGDKNPLDHGEKVKFMRAMFPKHARQIQFAPDVKTLFNVARQAYEDGYTQLNMVVGADRVKEFTERLTKYNGVEVKNKSAFYNFDDGVRVLPSGKRKKGISGTDLRKHVADGNYDEFAKVLPKDFKRGRDLFNAVRIGLGLKESYFGANIDYSPDVIREAYIKGDIFRLGDKIVETATGAPYTISKRYTNYVGVDTPKGQKTFFLSAIKPCA